MIYNELLYYLGFLPSATQVVILVMLGILSIVVFRSKKSQINLWNFMPIFLTLSLTIANKVIYFFTMIDIADETNLLRFIFIICLFFFIFKNCGQFWIYLFIIISGLCIILVPLRLIVWGILDFFLFTSIVQNVSIFVGIFFFGRKLVGLTSTRLWIYLAIGIVLSLIIGPVLAIELLLFARSFELCIKNASFLGAFHWVLLFMIGFFMNYLIWYAFAHIWFFIVVFILLKKVYKKIS